MNHQNGEEKISEKRKLVEDEKNSGKKPRKSAIYHRPLPVELLNEFFGSLPLENAFGLLDKMPNGLLARNVQKIIKGIKEAMKNNKLNENYCGPKLLISEEGLIAKYFGPNLGRNSIRAILPIPTFKLKGIINKPKIAFYFEIQILNKSNPYSNIFIGCCDEKFPLEIKRYGQMENSIIFYCKRGIRIDGFWTGFYNDDINFEGGDIIGIGIINKPNSSMECFATGNGQFLGKAELPSKFGNLQLYPFVNLSRENEVIRVNFGKEEWHFKHFKQVLEVKEQSSVDVLYCEIMINDYDYYSIHHITYVLFNILFNKYKAILIVIFKGFFFQSFFFDY